MANHSSIDPNHYQSSEKTVESRHAMNVGILGYTIVFSLSAVACLASIPRARSIQHPGTREGFVLLLVSVALWSAGYVGYLLAPTTRAKYAFYLLGFVFALVAVAAWLYFCAAYTGRPPKEAPYRHVAVTVFLLIVALKITNPLHNLYFTTEWSTDPFPHLAIHNGLFYWVILGLSYAVIAVGFFMLIELLYHTGTDTRPLVGLAGLTAIPAAATILSERIEGLLPLMYEPAGVAVFAVGTLFVYLRRFEAIQLTGRSDEPALFLDADEYIRDFNQAALAIFPELQGSMGVSLDSLNPALAEHLDSREAIPVSRDDETRYYDVSGTPFISGEIETGRLVTVTDVTERERYRQQLETKSEQLEALNRVIRHDIRNDMMVVRAWSEELQDSIDEEGQSALDRVLRKSRHVIELTDIARDVVESLTAEETAELEPIALREVLQSELATVRDSHPTATYRVSGAIPAVSVQANEMLSSVFRNLFENAVQHNDESTPEITVSCVEEDETVRVRIADNGPGVPDGQKEAIFGKDEKGLESTGTGIGLYLVHTLTEQVGGRVWVEDNDPKGAVFVVELPKAD